MITLVTFDVTNTILRILGGVGHQYASVARLYDVSADPEKLNQTFKQAWKEQNVQYPNYGASRGLTAHSWWKDVVKKCFHKADYNVNEKTISLISSHLFKHFTTSQAWEVVDGTHHVLQSVRDRGIKLGVLSNFDDRLEKILRSTALFHYFDFILCSQVFQFAKPDPGIFHRTLELGHCIPSEALHVGDNVEKDFFGAKNVGMTAVLFSQDKAELPVNVDPNFVISDLNELLKYLY